MRRTIQVSPVALCLLPGPQHNESPGPNPDDKVNGVEPITPPRPDPLRWQLIQKHPLDLQPQLLSAGRCRQLRWHWHSRAQVLTHFLIFHTGDVWDLWTAGRLRRAIVPKAMARVPPNIVSHAWNAGSPSDQPL